MGAAFGGSRSEAACYEDCHEILDRTRLLEKANALAGALTLLERKRLEMARALATRPRVLLLDEIAGGLTEHECGALIETIKAIHRTGVSIVWIEHVVACAALGREPISCHQLRPKARRGRSAAGDGERRGAGGLHGDQRRMSTAPDTVLATHDLTAFYGDFQALFGIDVHVARGETVAIIGANGAGKSTFLRSVVGQLPSAREQVMFEGQPVGHLPAHEMVRRGIALVPEGRLLFPSLSVEENLRLGAYGKRPGPWRIERVHELFPVLRERRATPGTALSGGEQQMCAIGRALMSNPTLLLCDELSLGLARSSSGSSTPSCP